VVELNKFVNINVLKEGIMNDGNVSSATAPVVKKASWYKNPKVLTVAIAIVLAAGGGIYYASKIGLISADTNRPGTGMMNNGFVNGEIAFDGMGFNAKIQILSVAGTWIQTINVPHDGSFQIMLPAGIYEFIATADNCSPKAGYQSKVMIAKGQVTDYTYTFVCNKPETPTPTSSKNSEKSTPGKTQTPISTLTELPPPPPIR
jgi:hypothetical protein